MQTTATSSSAETHVVPVSPFLGLDDELWKLLEPSIPKGFLERPNVEELITIGRWQLWRVVGANGLEGAVTTEVVTHPKRKTFVIRNAGANGCMQKDQAREVEAVFEGIAREQGCQAIEVMGRDGWGKIFPGFTKVSSTYRKELSDG